MVRAAAVWLGPGPTVPDPVSGAIRSRVRADDHHSAGTVQALTARRSRASAFEARASGTNLAALRRDEPPATSPASRRRRAGVAPSHGDSGNDLDLRPRRHPLEEL